MKLTQFVLHPSVNMMSRLYIMLMHRDDKGLTEGLYEVIPFDSLSDETQETAKVMEQEGLLFLGDNVEFAPCFDALTARKHQYLYSIAVRVYKHDVKTGFVDCPDELLPF